jgi:hypothetical protein
MASFFFVCFVSQRRMSTVFGLGAILSLWHAKLRSDPMRAATWQPFGQPLSPVVVMLEGYGCLTQKAAAC